MPQRAAILRWTGRGEMGSLRSSVEFVLRDRGVRGKVDRVGNSLVVVGAEPASVCSMFQHMPGVAWTAAGYAGRSLGGLAKASAALAPRYIRRGERFFVEAEVTPHGAASDLAGAVTARILEAVKGARVSQESPKVRFTAALDGRDGVVGVEVVRGPGGVPTGSESAVCLVSGGKHSAVLAWSSVLAGLKVKLVHVKSDEQSLLAVARLYSELSHRSDPRGLRLEVIETPSVPGPLARYAKESGLDVYAGFTFAGGEIPPGMRKAVKAPLYLVPEERFEAEFESLGLRSHDAPTVWGETGGREFRTRRFGGVTADVSRVIDGLA